MNIALIEELASKVYYYRDNIFDISFNELGIDEI